MACADCAAGTVADKLQEPLCSEEMTSNRAAMPDSEPISDAAAAECGSAESSDSADCVIVSATTCTSPRPVISTAAAAGPFESSSTVNDGCVSSTVSSAEERADRLPDCAAWGMDSPVDTFSERVITTGQKTDDGSSTSSHNQYSQSLVAVDCHIGAEKCKRISDIPQKCSAQASIRSFFAPLSKKQPDETAVCSAKNNVTPAASISPQNFAPLLSASQQSDANSIVTSEHSTFTDKTRKCPFYKWIPGM